MQLAKPCCPSGSLLRLLVVASLLSIGLVAAPMAGDSPHLRDVEDSSGLWLQEATWQRSVSEFRQQTVVPQKLPDLLQSSHIRWCPAACGEGGTCNIFTGRCSCKLGRKGAACTQVDHLPCNNPDGIWGVSTCFGECRDTRCFCGHGSKNPNRPMKAAFYIEAVEMWERAIQNNNTAFMEQWDIDPKLTPRMQWLRDRKDVTLDMTKAWCSAHKGNPTIPRNFGCIWAEHHGNGQLCAHTPRESVCLNQCSGHGHCDRGMCACSEGWYGIDCSLQVPSSGSQAGALRLAGRSLAFEGNQRRPRIFIYELPETFNSRVLQFRRRGICTTREFNPDMGHPEFHEWLYNVDFMLLEWLLHSPYRTIDPEEADFFFVPFLSSCYNFLGDDHPRHRLVHGCRMIATAQASKLIMQHLRETYPFWDRKGGRDHIWLWNWDEGGCAAPAAIRSSILLSHWGGRYTKPRTAYGPDNWLRPDLNWDVPHSKGPFGMAFQDLAMSPGIQYELFDSRGVEWKSHEEERGPDLCYDPTKDIVLPPPYFGWQSSAGSLYLRWKANKLIYPHYNSDWLFYFAGDLGIEAHQAAGVPGGRVESHYSRGVRQRLAKEFLGEKWQERGFHVYPGRRAKYLDEMASSIFCGALPGDGWSNAYTWAILHGCIPVIIMDDVELAWANVMDYSSFSIRVAEDDIPKLYEILTAISKDTIASMQAKLHKIWPRFTYVKYRHDMVTRMKKLGYDVKALHSQTASPEAEIGDDAFETLLQVLYSRL